MLLSVQNVSYTIKDNKILQYISMYVKEGEIVGIIGPSGSGKTSLLRHIIGVLGSNGKIKLRNKDVPYDGMYKESGYMLQSDALYMDLSAYDNLMFFATMYGLKNKKQAIDEILEICELTPHKNVLVRNYSGGMKRRLSFAVAFINKPSFLVLDEPTVGIDPSLRERFWQYFYELKKDDKSIIITTHIMSDAEMCDNIFIMKNGQIIGSGAPKDLKQKLGTDNMDEVYSLMSQKN